MSTPVPPETMVCDVGWEDITAVSEAALTVIVFMSKVPCVRAMVLPEVWPVIPLQLVGTVVTITVELLATPEGILPLMVQTLRPVGKVIVSVKVTVQPVVQDAASSTGPATTTPLASTSDIEVI